MVGGVVLLASVIPPSTQKALLPLNPPPSVVPSPPLDASLSDTRGDGQKVPAASGVEGARHSSAASESPPLASSNNRTASASDINAEPALLAASDSADAAGGGNSGSSGGAERWDCPMCTYANQAATKRCAMCNMERQQSLLDAQAQADKMAARISSLTAAETAWLHACIGAVEGEVGPVRQYLAVHTDGSTAAAARSRTISVEESTMLAFMTGRDTIFNYGASLVDLALRFQHQDVVGLGIVLPHHCVPAALFLIFFFNLTLLLA